MISGFRNGRKHTKTSRRQEIRFVIQRIRRMRKAYIDYALAGFQEVAHESWAEEIPHQIKILNDHLKRRFSDPD